jgi:hypothetical protein
VIEIGDDSRIRGILLFGTPHFDAGLAQWAILSGQEKGIKGCEKTAELQNWSKYTKNIEDPTEEKGLWAILWKFMGYSKDQKEKKVKINENEKDLDAIADMQKEFCRKYTGRKQCIRLACCFSEGCHPRNDLVSSFSSDIILRIIRIDLIEDDIPRVVYFAWSPADSDPVKSSLQYD